MMTARTGIPLWTTYPERGVHRSSSIAVAALLSGILAAASGAAASAQDDNAPRWTPARAMGVASVGDVQPSPDGRRVVYTVTRAVMTGDKSELVSQVWISNANGSEPRAFTRSDRSSGSPQWTPDGRWLIFTSRRPEHNNLWRIRSDGGEAEQITDLKTGIVAFQVSPDGRIIAFTRPEEPGTAEDEAKKQKLDVRVVDETFHLTRLWVVPVEKEAGGARTPRLLTREDWEIEPRFDWSPDAKEVVFAHRPTPRADDWTKSDLSVVDVASSRVRPLARTGAAESQPLFSPDGRSVAYVASDDPPTWPGDQHVVVVDAAGGIPRTLAETYDHKPTLLGWSFDGRRIYYQEARGTLARLCALPADGGAPIDLEPVPGLASFHRMNFPRTALGYSGQSSERAPEAFVTTLEPIAPCQVSHANEDLPKVPLGRTETLRWKSSDGVEIEGLLTYPARFEPGKRYPLLLLVHGGPAGGFNQSFIGSRGIYPVAVFAAEGYAVLRPNPRGSAGYGRAFRYSNRRDWGGGDFRDLMAGVDRAIEMGVADPDRLGVMGWSYGGFMSAWVITQTRRFRAAVVGAAVTDLVSFNGTSDIPGFVPDYFGAESWDDFDLYRAHSPLGQVKGVTTPTLILHGEVDVRVPISQGYELYNALRRQRVQVKMVVYPRQGHGPQEPKFIVDIGERTVEWFNRHLEAKATK